MVACSAPPACAAISWAGAAGAAALEIRGAPRRAGGVGGGAVAARIFQFKISRPKAAGDWTAQHRFRHQYQYNYDFASEYNSIRGRKIWGFGCGPKD